LLLEGRNKEAITSLKKAIQVDPLVAAYQAWLGMLYFWMGHNDEAIEEANKSLELIPDFPIALYALGSVYASKGMFEQAIEAHQKLATIAPDFKTALGLTYALAGREEEARQVAIEQRSRKVIWDTWGLAEIYAALGDNDEAFYWLEAAFEQKHPYIQWIWKNPNLKSLRSDPRFENLAKRLNVTE
jgi:tetratricopeptide (TPR) repeat protein